MDPVPKLDRLVQIKVQLISLINSALLYIDCSHNARMSREASFALATLMVYFFRLRSITLRHLNSYSLGSMHTSIM